MKNELLSTVLVFCATLTAQEAPLKLSGTLQTDDRVLTKSDAPLDWQEYRLSLKAEAKAGGSSRFFSETWVRALGTPAIRDDPSLSLREAYFDVYGFLNNRLDIRIGRQRIAWGTGDKVNPTDNLNADDLEDIYDFGRHLGSDGVKLTGYAGPWTLTGVFLPAFRKAQRPVSSIQEMLMPMPVGLPVVDDVPGATIKDGASAGLRLSSNILNTDMSLSYYYGRDDLPVGQASIHMGFTGLDTTLYLRYPRIQVIGADFAGQLATIGIRGEFGLFLPEAVRHRIDVDPAFAAIAFSSVPLPDPGAALKDDPYVKWALGLDYTLPIDVYLNVQWVHGLPFERGEELEDYLLANADWTVLNGKLKVSPLGIGLEMKDFDDLSEHYAVFGQPQITGYPVDNTELGVGARIIEGKTGTHFGALKELDEVFVKARYSF